MQLSPATRTFAGQLGAFAAGLELDDLPAQVHEMLPSLVKDQLACQTIGSGVAHNALVRRYALEETPGGDATVIGSQRRARPEWAALANATAGHGFEMDDSHARALAHPGCVVVPTVLAVGEQLDASGHEALVALALGYELALRVGLAVQPSMVRSRGFHETCVEGVFGAAAAAGRLMGLSAEQHAAALGIAGSHASGTIEYAQSGGEVKRLHAGLGAMGGIRSARLAELGLTGPARILEGKRGIIQAVAEETDPAAVVDGLGSAWTLTETCAKEFCGAWTLHGPIKAVREIVQREQLPPEQIERIVAGVDEFSAGHLGTLGPRPTDLAGAQFSLHYSLAMTVVLGGNGHEEYLQVERDNFGDPAIAALAERVEVEVDADATAAFPQRMRAVVHIVAADGRTYVAHGEATPTWDFDFVTQRFAAVVPNAQAVARAIDDLFDDRPVREILAPLTTEIGAVAGRSS